MRHCGGAELPARREVQQRQQRAAEHAKHARLDGHLLAADEYAVRWALWAEG